MRLLERERFLEQLNAHLGEVLAGEGRLVLLGGEAGVGKTVLVQQFCRSAQKSARLLVGGCDPLSTPRPLGPLVDMAAGVGGELERLLEQAGQRDRVFSAFLALLASGGRPAVVVFEDVHWADEATLDLLRYLGRRLAATRALLLATYRDDEVGPGHPLRVVMGDLATSGGVRRLSLPALSEAAVRTLASASAVDPVALHRLTGGNPFFVTEVLAAGGAGIPVSVRDAVLARAARLSPDGRAALEAAAVIGSRVEPWLLTQITGPTAQAAEECLASGMLRADGDLVAFRHELAREAVIEAVSPYRRVALHRSVLEALRARPPGPDSLARLAHHAEEAENGQAVLEYAPAAAQRAADLRAHREAAAQFARALRFSDGLAPTERALLLEQYARESFVIGSPSAAIEAQQAALAIWRQSGDRLKEGETLTVLSGFLVSAGRNAEAEVASRAAIEVLEPLGHGRQLAGAYGAQAALRMLNRDNDEAVSWGQKAIALAEHFRDAETLAAAYNRVGSALLLQGDERGRTYLERSISLASEAGLDSAVAVGYSNLGSVAGELYQFELADRYLDRGIAFTLQRDLDGSRQYMLSWKALSLLYQGHWGEAAEAALAVTRAPDAVAIGRMMALIALGRLRARRGDPEVWVVLNEALELAARTETLQRLGPVRAARAEAASLAGDRERVLHEVRTAYDLALRHKHTWHTGELAYWQWRAGESIEVPPWAAEPFARQIAGDWRTAAAQWRARSCPYEAARALSESEDEAALKEALAEFERLGARPMAAVVARKLRELGARAVPRGPRAATRAHPAGLTPREAEVLQLLGDGLRDAEIAARLCLSPKTVGHHVSAILGKLGARSRAEAARLAAMVPTAAQDREPLAPI